MPASPTPPEAVAALLAVSDEVGEREVLGAAVTWQRVLTAATVEEGLTAVDGASGLAVVVAAHGPSFDGASVLRKLRAERPDCRRVLVVRDPSDASLDAIDACRPHRVLRAWPDARSLGPLVRALCDWSRRARERRGGARDPLTGLYSPVGFEERLREELARARRYGKPLSILCGGLDVLDDSAGEGVALERIAGFLLAPDHPDRLRESDVAGRLASGDIAILLPETSKEGAAVKAERVRLAVVEAARAGGAPARASVGVAGFPDDADSPIGLLQCAEQALTAARGSASSCVRLAIGAGAADVGRRRVALDPDDFAVLRRERFATYHVRLFDVVSALRRDHSLSCLFVDLSRAAPGRARARADAPRRAARPRRRPARRDARRSAGRRGPHLPHRGSRRLPLLPGLAARRHRGRHRPGRSRRGSSRSSSATGRGGDRAPPRRAARRGRLRARARQPDGPARAAAGPAGRRGAAIARCSPASAPPSATRRCCRTSSSATRLRAVYQPIVDLATGEVFGFEALTRGPRESAMESPATLFSVADEVDLTFELDRACFRGALRGAVGLEPVHRLFLNLLPTSFYDSSLHRDRGVQPARGGRAHPGQHRLRDHRAAGDRELHVVPPRARRLHPMGFGVAIDDVGTRHSNLETVMALRPRLHQAVATC